MTNVVKTMHQPPMTGKGLFIQPFKHGDDWGMVYYCFTHINKVLITIKHYYSHYYNHY